MIALAESSARYGGEGSEEGASAAVETLLRQLSRARSGGDRWAALALGVFGRRSADDGRTVPAELAGAILSALDETGSPEDVAAFSIALGLLADPRAEEVLAERLEDVRDDAARGYVAVGLALSRSFGASDRLREILVESKYRPDLLQQVAVALGLLGDTQTGPELLQMLGEARTLAGQAGVAVGLGLLGDRRAVEPLVGLLQDDEQSASARAFAAAALGLVSDRERLPFNTPLSVGVNYPAAPPTLLDQEGFGVLNVL